MTARRARQRQAAWPAALESMLDAALVPALVLLAAAAVRLFDLVSQPGGLYPDEGAEGLDAYRLLHLPGYHPVFFTSDAGREALYGYIVAAAFKVFGAGVEVLRGVSAGLGVVGVLLIYLALRRFGRGAALAGMAWSAGALWLVCISRDGMRNILALVLAAGLLWALLRWVNLPGRNSALVAGAVAGAGLWTYQPLKLAPLLVAALVGWVLWQDRPRLRPVARTLGWLGAAYLVVAAPMIVTAVVDPGLYFGRAVGVSAINPANGGVGIVEHTVQTLLMFTTTGDPNPRHNVASLPMLGWPLFLVAGAGVVRAWRRRRDPGHGLLLLGLVVFMIPPLVAVDGGVPHFLRSIAIAPFLAGLIGQGCVELVDLARRPERGWLVGGATVALAALLVGTGAAATATYLGRPVADRYEAYSFDIVAAAQQAAAPGSALVIDEYNQLDTDFLDAASPPEVFRPGVRIDRPGRFRRVVALSRDDLAAALGPATAARASVVESDPQGRPRVFVVTP